MKQAEETSVRRPVRRAASLSRVSSIETYSSILSLSIEEAVKKIVALCTEKSLMVISGSGASLSSGLSTFSSDGFYERAQKRYKLKDGMELFRWRFYAEEPRSAMQFLGTMCDQVLKCKPNSTHKALADLEKMNVLLRHYTLNIDGLHTLAGASTWDPDLNSTAATVELHGSLRDIVDTDTGDIYAVDPRALHRIKRKRPAFKEKEEETSIKVLRRRVDLGARRRRKYKDQKPVAEDVHKHHPSRYRFRILFYDDEEDEYVLDAPAALALLDSDAARAHIILWLGISFYQSASCEYLRRVAKHAPSDTLHLIVNPSPEAAFNATSAIDTNDTDIRAVYAQSDDLFAALFALPSFFSPYSAPAEAAAHFPDSAEKKIEA